jgi:hypothetical protein
MALTMISPFPVAVRCDLLSGRPRSLRLAGRRLHIVRVCRVRDEIAAHPRVHGPRTVFVVDTPEGRMCLSYDHRSHAWSVEGLDGDPATRSNAA